MVCAQVCAQACAWRVCGVCVACAWRVHIMVPGVHRLHRESFGSLSLDSMQLPEGSMRPMTDAECAQVQAMLPPSRTCPEREHSSRWLGAGGGTTTQHDVDS